MTFILHPQLEKDCVVIGDLPLCRALLMNNRHFPWLILVPRRENMRELFDLPAEDYATVMAEARFVSERFSRLHHAHKMNVAALGNVVPQLHIHIIARFENDAAWPKPVWNAAVETEPYSAESLPHILLALQKEFNITKM